MNDITSENKKVFAKGITKTILIGLSAILLASITLLPFSAHADTSNWKRVWGWDETLPEEWSQPFDSASLMSSVWEGVEHGEIFKGTWRNPSYEGKMSLTPYKYSDLVYQGKPYLMISSRSSQPADESVYPRFTENKEEWYRVYTEEGFYRPFKDVAIHFIIYENEGIANKVFERIVKKPNILGYSILGSSYDYGEVTDKRRNEYREYYSPVNWEASNPKPGLYKTIGYHASYITELKGNVIIVTTSKTWLNAERQDFPVEEKGEYLTLVDVQMLHQIARNAANQKVIGDTLTLEHFHPFEYFKAGTGTDIAPAGQLVATLKDKNGKPIEGKTIFFYAVKELNPNDIEPGKNLRGVLRPMSGPGGSGGFPIFNIFDIDEETFWSSDVTDKNGQAIVNYLHYSYSLINADNFALALQRQTAIHNILGREDGKISGTIKAALIKEYDANNPANAVILESIPFNMEFRALAKILSITGSGQPDDTTEGAKYPGRVRVKRDWCFPKFDYKPVEEGFLLMPGDIIDIDGNASVEIAFVNGDKVIAKVPGTLKLDDTELTVYHARLALMSTAYESGFMTTAERLGSKFTGASIGKGIELLIKSIPYIGELVKFGVDVYKEGEFDFKEHGIMTKIRVRSHILVDNTGQEVKIYNFNGSPDVKTVGGSEITLSNGEMATVSDGGTLSLPHSFNVKTIEKEFYESSPAIPRGKSAGTNGTGIGAEKDIGWIWTAFGVAVIAIVSFLLVRLNRKKKRA